jgi:DNA-binding LacI/PurR family transcriptional regulator
MRKPVTPPRAAKPVGTFRRTVKQLAPAKIPRVAFLHWYEARSLPNSYCADLFNHFQLLKKNAELNLTVLGRGAQDNAPPFPDIKQVRDGRFDAIVSNGIWNPDYLLGLKSLGVPVVSCDNLADTLPLDSVTFSDEEAGEQIGRMLARSGHRQVLFVTRMRNDAGAVAGADPLIEDTTSLDRRMGVQRGLLGTAAEYWPVLPWNGGTKALVKAMMKRFERVVEEAGRWPDAIVVPDLGLGAAVLAELKARKLAVPRDISMVGFHAPPVSTQPAGKISHMCYSWRSMAETAWNLLKSRLEHRQKSAPQHLKLPAVYVDCGSVLERKL